MHSPIHVSFDDFAMRGWFRNISRFGLFLLFLLIAIFQRVFLSITRCASHQSHQLLQEILKNVSHQTLSLGLFSCRHFAFKDTWNFRCNGIIFVVLNGFLWRYHGTTWYCCCVCWDPIIHFQVSMVTIFWDPSVAPNIRSDFNSIHSKPLVVITKKRILGLQTPCWRQRRRLGWQTTTNPNLGQYFIQNFIIVPNEIRQILSYNPLRWRSHETMCVWRAF
mmetsp:Transcript_23318/g.54150  ORF Transcript_23318/g.54150 Transcript_23318/m.54150 type:complete len:220 (-) Transcript_23318:215-874(-)